MSDDSLLNALAAEARAQEDNSIADEQQWERYAAGTLSDEELKVLLARTPPEVIESRQAIYAPFDKKFKNQLAGSVNELLASEGAPAPRHDASADVLPLRSNRVKIFAPFALAATLLLALGTWQFGLGTQEYSEFPAYTMTVVGGSQYRSTQSTDEIPSFARGDRLAIRLTPATSVDQTLQSKVYVLEARGLTPLSGVSVEQAPSGAVRISARVGETIVLKGGLQQLIVVLSSQGQEPEQKAILKQIGKSDVVGRIAGDGWQAWRVSLHIDDGQ